MALVAAGGIIVVMSAMQHSLEWSPPAFSLLSFAQMWSTADPLSNLKLTVRLQGIRHLSNLLRPAYLDGCEDLFGKESTAYPAQQTLCTCIIKPCISFSVTDCMQLINSVTLHGSLLCHIPCTMLALLP